MATFVHHFDTFTSIHANPHKETTTVLTETDIVVELTVSSLRETISVPVSRGHPSISAGLLMDVLVARNTRRRGTAESGQDTSHGPGASPSSS